MSGSPPQMGKKRNAALLVCGNAAVCAGLQAGVPAQTGPCWHSAALGPCHEGPGRAKGSLGASQGGAEQAGKGGSRAGLQPGALRGNVTVWDWLLIKGQSSWGKLSPESPEYLCVGTKPPGTEHSLVGAQTRKTGSGLGVGSGVVALMPGVQ